MYSTDCMDQNTATSGSIQPCKKKKETERGNTEIVVTRRHVIRCSMITVTISKVELESTYNANCKVLVNRGFPQDAHTGCCCNHTCKLNWLQGGVQITSFFLAYGRFGDFSQSD